MSAIFYIHASIAVISMGFAMLTSHVVHALLFAVASLISLAVSLYSLSAELAAALLVIIYAGAIMVLFVFAVMLLKPEVLITEKFQWKDKKNLSFLLMVFFFFCECLWVMKDGFLGKGIVTVSLSDIAAALFSTYGFYVEVISFVLLAGLVTAIFVARSLNRAKKAQKAVL